MHKNLLFQLSWLINIQKKKAESRVYITGKNSEPTNIFQVNKCGDLLDLCKNIVVYTCADVSVALFVVHTHTYNFAPWPSEMSPASLNEPTVQ